MPTVNRIPLEYWNEKRGRYNSHRFFNTVNHWHISDYSREVHCDLMLVECADGRFYIEDNWGGDANGHEKVFNPFQTDSYPVFFSDFDTANEVAAKVVAEITGNDYKKLMIDDDGVEHENSA